MITRAERLELFKSYARERDCALCKDWPRAEKAARRMEVLNFPKGICIRCDLAFWQSICVVTDGQEEFEARDAVREERRKPPASRRHGQEILDETRRKAAPER